MPEKIPDFEHGSPGIIIVPSDFDLVELYNLASQWYEYDYNYWEVEHPSNDTDGGDGDGGDGDGGDGDGGDGDGGVDPMECYTQGCNPFENIARPPLLSKGLDIVGIRSLVIEPKKIMASYKLSNMDSNVLTCMFEMAKKEAGLTNIKAEAFVAMEWNADGALNYMVLYLDGEFVANTVQKQSCGYNDTTQACIPCEEGKNFPTLNNEKVVMKAMMFLQRDGYGFPNKTEIDPVAEEQVGINPPDEYQERPLAKGTNMVSLYEDKSGVKLSLEVKTKWPCTLQTGLWEENPTETGVDPGFVEGAGVYFMIGADNESAIEFPIILKTQLPVDIPSSLVGAAAEKIAEALKIVTWDESSSSWKEEEFKITYNSTSKEIYIEIEHLSIFAVGFDEQSLLMIPGYSIGLMVVAVVSAVAVVARRIKRFR